MELFSYSFALTMLHSIWQSAILLIIYFMLTGMFSNAHPVTKRNLLFILLSSQLFISAYTFTLYFNNFFGITGSFKYTDILFDQTWLRTYSSSLFNIYMFAVVYHLGNVFYNWISFKRKHNNNLVKPPVDLKVFAIVKAGQFGIKRYVSLWLSNTVASPVTFGFWKPVILLPVALVNKLTISEVESLIVHELTHIKYNDFLLNFFLIITESIYFFNPFIKIISRKIQLEREKNCDIKVIDFNYPGIYYAETLLKIAKERIRIKNLQLGAVLNRPQLIHRIQYFSRENIQFRNKNKTLISWTGVILGIIINLSILLHATKIEIGTASPIITTKEYSNDLNKNMSVKGATTLSKSQIIAPSMPYKKHRTGVTKNDFIESTEGEDLNYALASGNLEPTIDAKELIVNEEDSSGKITSAYNVEFKNGEWVVQPLWMISEIKMKADSLKSKADSLVKFFNTIQ